MDSPGPALSHLADTWALEGAEGPHPVPLLPPARPAAAALDTRSGAPGAWIPWWWVGYAVSTPVTLARYSSSRTESVESLLVHEDWDRRSTIHF